MNLEQQVTNRELSEKLKSLNVKQESLFYWSEYTYYSDDRELTTDWLLKTKKEVDKWVGLTFSAFTIAELAQIAEDLDPSGEAAQEYLERNLHPASTVYDSINVNTWAQMLISLVETNLLQAS